MVIVRDQDPPIRGGPARQLRCREQMVRGAVLMKWIVLIIAMTSLFLTRLGAAESTPWSSKLPFEQGVITYEISGMESGREMLYVTDFGATSARHRQTSVTILGITQKQSSIEITTPEWIYSFDLQEKTGSKSLNPQKLMIEEYEKLTRTDQKKVNENARKMANLLMGDLHASVEQNVKEILGYSCDRTQALGSTVYSIHGTGVSLLSETDLMGIQIKSIAVSIDTKRVDASVFEFPEGIEIEHDEEADQMARIIAQQTMAALKDPDNITTKSQGIMGLPSSEQPEIPEEDQMEMEEAMKTIRGLLGN